MNKKIFRIIAALYLAGSAVGGVTVLLSAEPKRTWMSFVGMAFVLLPLVASKIFRFKRSYLTDSALIVFIFFAFEIGVAMNLYNKLWFYDIIVHGVSGIVFTEIGLCVYWYLKADKKNDIRLEAGLAAAFSVCFSMTVSGLWEMLEYIGFLLTGHDSQNIASTGVGDTMEDMMICLVCSLVAGALMLLYFHGKHKSILIKPSEDFIKQNKD